MAEANKKIRKKPKQEIDEIVGKVIYHKEFSSTLLNNKRDVIVWLPQGYDSPKKKDKSISCSLYARWSEYYGSQNSLYW
jgi:enterochelin esterase-like enzyme